MVNRWPLTIQLRGIQLPRRNISDNCSAVQAGKKRRHKNAKFSSKFARKRLKGAKKSRSKSRTHSSPSSSSDSSSCCSSSSSSSDSDSDGPLSKNIISLLPNSSVNEEDDVDNTLLSEEIVEFAAAAAFKGPVQVG